MCNRRYLIATTLLITMLAVYSAYSQQQSELLWVQRGNAGGMWMLGNAIGPTILSYAYTTRSVRRWDMATGKLLNVLVPAPAGFQPEWSAYSSDGRYIAVYTYNGPVILYDGETGLQIAASDSITYKQSTSTQPIFSNDSRYILMAEAGGYRVLSVPTMERVSTIPLITSEGGAVLYGVPGPISRSFARSEKGGISLLDLATGTVVKRLSGEPSTYYGPFFAEGGRTIAAIHNIDSRVALTVWDVAAGSVKLTLNDSLPSYVYHRAATPNGRYLALAEKYISTDSSIHVWDIAEGRRTGAIGYSAVGQYIQSMGFTADGEKLLLGTGQLSFVDPQSMSVTRSLVAGHLGAGSSAAYSPDGAYLATGAEDYTVKLWNAATGELIRQMKGLYQVMSSIAFSPDGTRLAAAESYSLTSTNNYKTWIHIWETSTGRSIDSFPIASGGIRSIAISPDGQYLASAGEDNITRLWRFATGELVQTFIGHGGAVHSVAFSPDGNYIATGSADWTVKLWEVSTGNLVQTFNGHLDKVNTVSFTSDGQHIVSGSNDKTIRIWRHGEASARIVQGHTQAVTALSLADAEQWILSASGDGTIRAWDFSSGKLLHSFTDPMLDTLTTYGCVTLSPNHSSVASVGSDGSVFVWPTRVLSVDVDHPANSGRELLTIYPNPASASTSIGIVLQEAADVSLKVYDMLGREVAVLAEGRMNAGEHHQTWDVAGRSSGIYQCVLQAGARHETRMIVIE